jgi:DNA-binding response OmpR family regulator
MRILLVEDEEKLAEALKAGLTKKGYAVDVINNGGEAFKRISLNHIDYDLVVLDLMLPDMSGIEITRSMREVNITTPILVLTARNEVEMKVDLLLSGADDYLSKPFSFDELNARIQAIFRRPKKSLPTIMAVMDIELNSSSRKVHRSGEEVLLTLKEFVLLEYFMRNPNRVINREELLSHLWDFNYSSFSNVVDVHVKNLRKKLEWGDSKNVLETVRGVGYRLKK